MTITRKEQATTVIIVSLGNNRAHAEGIECSCKEKRCNEFAAQVEKELKFELNRTFTDVIESVLLPHTLGKKHNGLEGASLLVLLDDHTMNNVITDRTDFIGNWEKTALF